MRTLLAILFLIVSSWAQKLETLSDGRKVVAGEVIVSYKSKAVHANKTTYDIDVENEIGAGIAHYRLHSRSKTTAQLLALLAKDNAVASVAPNGFHQLWALPNDPYFTASGTYAQYYLYNENYTEPVTGKTGTNGADINVVPAWAITTGSSNVLIADEDEAFSYRNADMYGNVWSSPASYTLTVEGTQYTCPAGSHGFDPVGLTCDPCTTAGYCTTTDQQDTTGACTSGSYCEHGNGTEGISSAVCNNSLDICGVGYTLKTVLIKDDNSSGTGTDAQAIDGLGVIYQLVQLGYNIKSINVSWSLSGPSTALYSAIQNLNSVGVIVATAAGNLAMDLDTDYPAGIFPQNYATAQSYLGTAALPNIINISSTALNDDWYNYDYGTVSVPLASPGYHIITLGTSSAEGWTFAGTGNGTSFSSPQLNGAIGLIYSVCPGLSVAALRNVLFSKARYVSGLSSYVGYGVLNVGASVSYASTNCTLLTSIQATSARGMF
jgi:hypothetical protein